MALSSLSLWSVFTFFQTVRHRDYPPPVGASDEAVHAAPPTPAETAASFALLLVSLVAVVGLAKVLSPSIESAVQRAELRQRSSVSRSRCWCPAGVHRGDRAALADRLQTSVNLAIGSALATIGLTVPVVVVVCILLDIPLVLGLGSRTLRCSR